MVVCPEGRESAALDYCDECGGRIGAANPSATSANVPDGSCPDCGTPRGGRFCEVCGRDFVLATGAAATTGAALEAAELSPGPVAPLSGVAVRRRRRR
ncbi:hypothetical protein GCM10010199_09960 [Dactylosporangium roseum]